MPILSLLLCGLVACGGGSPKEGPLADALESAETSVSAETSGDASSVSCEKSELLPELEAAVYPKRNDRVETYELGDVQITATPVVTVTDIEKGTNLYFEFSNSSSEPAKIKLVNWGAVAASRPSWLLHFWPVIENELGSDGSFDISVPANSEQSLKIYMSNESPPEGANATYRFQFALIGGGQVVEVPMEVTWVNGEFGNVGQRVPISNRLVGKVLSADGAPVAGAKVTTFLSNGLWRRDTDTFAAGNFIVDLVSDKGLAEFTGGRTTKPKAAWNLTVDKAGYRLASWSNMSLEHGMVYKCVVRLDSLTQERYELTSDLTFDDPYGFWDMELFGAGDRFVATPGWHPNEEVNVHPIPRPGHIVAIDLTGKLLWEVPVGDWCWRLAVSPDGKFIAANCADGYLRVIDANGVVVKQIQISQPTGYNSSAGLAFSPDGTKLFAGARIPGPMVLDTSTWEVLWTMPGDIYMAQWSDSPSQLVVASGFGVVSSYTSAGELRWRRGVGGVPLYINVDPSGRVTISGKSHTAYSWDADGNQLWFYELSNTTNRTRYGRGASADGNYLFFAGQQGLEQALDSNGKLLWQRMLPESMEQAPSGNLQSRTHNPGHGATYVAPDGSFVVIGARMNQVFVYGRDGSILWASEQFPPRRDDFDETGAYHPNANTVTATPDGRTIVAGYSDGSIRIFTKKG